MPRTCNCPSRAVTIIPVVPAVGAAGAAVDTTTPPLAWATRAASQVNRTSIVSGRYAVSDRSVDCGRPGSTGQLTVGSFTETGANGSRAAHTTATSADSPARRAVRRPRLAAVRAGVEPAGRRGGPPSASSAGAGASSCTALDTSLTAGHAVSRGWRNVRWA